MVILSNDKKTIQLSLSNIIHEDQKEGKYTVVLPFVICDNKKDAKQIQEKVNSYVSELSKELLK